jgi:hypothetical protein
LVGVAKNLGRDDGMTRISLIRGEAEIRKSRATRLPLQEETNTAKQKITKKIKMLFKPSEETFVTFCYSYGGFWTYLIVA